MGEAITSKHLNPSISLCSDIDFSTLSSSEQILAQREQILQREREKERERERDEEMSSLITKVDIFFKKSRISYS